MYLPVKPFQFENFAGEEIPAHAVFKSGGIYVDSEGRKLLKAEKPDGEGNSFYVNQGIIVGTSDDEKYGETDEDPIVAVLFDPEETPAIGEEWGPVGDEWFIGPTGTGFIIEGLEDEDLWPDCVQVRRAGGGLPCIRVWYLSLRGADGGTATLKVDFRDPEDVLTSDEWEITWDDSLTDLQTSWDALPTIAANPDIFTLEVLGGALPAGEVEIKITAAPSWRVELSWLSEELDGDFRWGLDRGYRSS